MFCIEYLESLYSMHSTLPPAPHVAEPLHPEVGGHGGVPDAAAAVVHAVGGVQHQLNVSVKMSESQQVLWDSPGLLSISDGSSPVLSVIFNTDTD